MLNEASHKIHLNTASLAEKDNSMHTISDPAAENLLIALLTKNCNNKFGSDVMLKLEDKRQAAILCCDILLL